MFILWTYLWKKRYQNTCIILRKKFWHISPSKDLICLYIRVFAQLQERTLETIGWNTSSIQKCLDVFKAGALTYAYMSYSNLVYFYF